MTTERLINVLVMIAVVVFALWLEWRAEKKRGFSTFFHKVEDFAGETSQTIYSRSKIDRVIEWSRTSRGGRQFNMFADFAEPLACASSYGLYG